MIKTMTSKRIIFVPLLITLLSINFACKKTTVVSVEDIALSSQANSKAVGASANELLSGTKPKLIIEVQYMKGFQLQQQSVTNLVNFLQSHVNKPGGVQVIQKEIPENGAETKGLSDIAKIEQQYRTAFNTDDQVSVHVLVTNSQYTTANVLGIAYRNTSVCLFGKTIQQNSEASGKFQG
jgi:hypothetical protein